MQTLGDSNRELVALFRSFYCVSNVGVYIQEVKSIIRSNPSKYSVVLSNGNFSVRCSYSVSGDEVVGRASPTNFARHVLWTLIVEKNLLRQSFYPMTSILNDALCTESGQLEERLKMVDLSLDETSPFTFRFSREQAKALCNGLGVNSSHLLAVCFCLGNYLGREPTRAEFLGGASLPKAAVIESVGVVAALEKFTENEKMIARWSVSEAVERADPVKGVRYKVWGKAAVEILSTVLEKKVCEVFLPVGGLIKVVLDSMLETEKNPETFEERIEWYHTAATLVRVKLMCVVPVKSVVDIEDLMVSVIRQDDEVIRGDAMLMMQKVPVLEKRNFLLSVGSQLEEKTFERLTRQLVQAFIYSNPKLNATFTEAVVFLLIRYAHYNTNGLRFIDLPNNLEFEFKGKREIVRFSAASEVMSRYKVHIHNIERAWCAPFATVAFQLLKQTGGSYHKWPDVMNLPSYMQFDFVGYTDPLVMSPQERKMLAELLARFKTRDTPVRGNSIGMRRANPADECFEKIVPEELRGFVRTLTS
uniref:Heat shock protein 90 n=1 Tax=croton golden spot associated virus A TaxID=3072821 RepID=A0AA51N0S3_9CLOS|nr:heat shock protein 90 [croton golden spot associated virus A]